MKANRSKTYLIPLLFKEIQFDRKFFTDIKNVYVRDTDKEYINCIFIEVSSNREEFKDLRELLQRNNSFIEIVKKENIDIYIFKFPKKFLKEYLLFKQSKYSKFGNDAKSYILSF